MRSGDRKTIFITGAASGIGRATARLFSERGWFVGAYDVDIAGLASLEKELGDDRCMVGELDVSDKAAFDRSMEEFSRATGGRLDLLFNNAGIGAGGWFEEVPYEVAMRVLEVNFIGVVNGVYAGIPLLSKTPGSLCFSTSSSAAVFGMPRTAMYSASKFAVKGLTEALSVELSRFGSRAADMMPALVDTPILETAVDHSSGEPPGLAMKKNATPEGAMRLVQPEEVAELVWEAYGSDRVHWYIPAEMEQVDRARGGGVEPLRDQFKKTVLGGS
ncbi:MAG: SDR family oxidoreductase [Deltaproteobacteria bacterium]|nr:SDR family oxidoreductase [Deltaproteobacteria bacterium]MBW2420996.1 SDR family oxidoreductase [Deltaproteobacteria bacterium]